MSCVPQLWIMMESLALGEEGIVYFLEEEGDHEEKFCG